MSKKKDKIDYIGLSEALQSDVKKLTEKLVAAQKELAARQSMIDTYSVVLNGCLSHLEQCITHTGVVTEEDIKYSRNLCRRTIEYEKEDKSSN